MLNIQPLIQAAIEHLENAGNIADPGYEIKEKDMRRMIMEQITKCQSFLEKIKSEISK